MKPRVLISLLLNLGWVFTGCSPLFSDMQSARLVPKKQFEFTPGYTSVGFVPETADEPAEGISNFLGFQAAVGLSDKVELRFRFEHSRFKSSLDEGQGFNANFTVVALGTKIRLVKDRLALLLPLGIGGPGLVQFQPTVLGTIPLVPNKIDVNPSAKHIFTVCGVCWQPLVAFNLGMALSSDISKWAIRPEYGVLYNLRTKSHFKSFAIGLSVNFSALSSKN